MKSMPRWHVLCEVATVLSPNQQTLPLLPLYSNTGCPLYQHLKCICVNTCLVLVSPLLLWCFLATDWMTSATRAGDGLLCASPKNGSFFLLFTSEYINIHCTTIEDHPPSPAGSAKQANAPPMPLQIPS